MVLTVVASRDFHRQYGARQVCPGEAEEGVGVRIPMLVGVLVRENLEPGLKVILN